MVAKKIVTNFLKHNYKKMKKIDFNKKFQELDGSAGGDQNKTLAQLFAYSDVKGEKALKHLNWGLKLMKDGVLECDDVDLKHVRDFILEGSSMALIKGQLVQTLDDGGEPVKGGG